MTFELMPFPSNGKQVTGILLGKKKNLYLSINVIKLLSPFLPSFSKYFLDRAQSSFSWQRCFQRPPY